MNKIYQKTLSARKNAGFTLIELLVVVLIIGVLAAAALPQYQLAVDKARFREIQTITAKLKDMIELYYVANGSYPKYWADLDIEIPGCTETGSAWYDLICPNMRIDLNGSNFNSWNSNTRDSSDFHYYYYFLYAGNGTESAGKFLCLGMNTRGKKLCKSLCGNGSCYMNE